MFPPVTQHVSTFYTFTHSKVAPWVKGSSFIVYEKEDLDYFRCINCINVCIRGYNCCQTGIGSSKYVDFASMGVKI